MYVFIFALFRRSLLLLSLFILLSFHIIASVFIDDECLSLRCQCQCLTHNKYTQNIHNSTPMTAMRQNEWWNVICEALVILPHCYFMADRYMFPQSIFRFTILVLSVVWHDVITASTPYKPSFTINNDVILKIPECSQIYKRQFILILLCSIFPNTTNSVWVVPLPFTMSLFILVLGRADTQKLQIQMNFHYPLLHCYAYVLCIISNYMINTKTQFADEQCVMCGVQQQIQPQI